MNSLPPAGALICAPEAILDVDLFAARIDDAMQGVSSDADRQQAILDCLAEGLAQGRKAISEAFLKEPYRATETIRAYTYLAECVLRLTVGAVQKHMHPIPTPLQTERLSVLFVGGSGRSEMAPFSDIDVLFLIPYKQTAWGESVIETVLHLLWDLKFKVGHSVRNVDDCLRLAKGDFTIRTNLLEARFLLGDAELAAELDSRLWDELFIKTGPEFVEAKLDERERRHKKHGNSRYLVEPNIKEGKGGLRDLQTLYWIAKYLNRTKSVHELVELGVFTEDEYRVFADADAFLWTIRCLLHLLSGRANEQLTFDMQVELAAALGFEDTDGQRGVERFMQTYFRHARHVGELTRVFLVDLENKLVKKQPTLGHMLRSAFRFTRERMPEGYVNRNGRLGIADPKEFLGRPINILKLFEQALETEFLIHPEAMRLVTANLDLIDDNLRTDPEANDVFLQLLLGTNNPERALRRMNELGVLGAFLPEFDRIVAMMQFNMYHHYTVDEHTIQCISVLSQIERQELVEDLPVVSGILREGVNRRVLYVALLLHDIGKGLPQDHSEVGAEIAAKICPRLGLPPEETDTVVWLVRHHLVMSDVAQKRDISDIRTVRDFVSQVRSVSNLKLLTVLTVCDIRGVGPGRWNNWKAVLFRDLYAMTLDELREGAGTQSRQSRVDAAKAQFKKHARHLEGEALEQELDRHYASFWIGCDLKTQIILSKLSRAADGSAFLSNIQMDKKRDATRACFAMSDHPGIFSRLTGALALAGANVVDARTFTTSDGVAISVFWIQDIMGAPYEKSRLGRLRKAIDRSLSGEVVPREALRQRHAIKRRQRDFVVPTTITIDNFGSEIFTIIEVDTKDRPSLLHDLARTLHYENLIVHSAIIATYGEQAVDAFYVKDLYGHKVHSEARQERIRERLRDAIDAAVTDAA